MDKTPESLVGEMSIMDTSGHKELKWNTGNSEEIRVAQETFDRLLGKGYTAFGAKAKNEPKHAIRKFDATMEELVMVPRTVGG